MAADAKPADAESAEIVTRRPDLVALAVIEHRDGIPVVTKTSRHLVVDRYSKVESFTLKKSLFGRRTINLSFNADGFLTAVGTEGSAALAPLATSVAQVPADVSKGVESVTKLRTDISAAQRVGLEAELARLKQEVELRQQQLIADGINATARDAARLQRLQQLASIIAVQTTIRGADPSLIASLRQAAMTKLHGIVLSALLPKK